MCPTLCDPMDCSPPGSSIHGIFQVRVLEWGAIKTKQLVLFASNYTAGAKRSLPYMSTVTQTLSLALGRVGRRCIWPVCHGREDGATGNTELETKPCQQWHLSCTCSFIPFHWMENRDFREMSRSLDPEVERISVISRLESIFLPGPSELIGRFVWQVYSRSCRSPGFGAFLLQSLALCLAFGI